MKGLIYVVLPDLKDFVRSNYKLLFLCLITVFVIQYLNKGDFITNISVITLHLIGDVVMIISLKKYSIGENKLGVLYQSSSIIFFLLVGFVAVIQSKDGKNWQYFLGTTPFLVANMYQFLSAWGIKGKRFFNYRVTMLSTIIISFLYYKFDLIYSHAWLQVFGYSLFPIFLGMSDSPRVYLGRILSVFIMLLGVTIDINVQYVYPEIIPSSAISSFFITLLAFFGFIQNASNYIENVRKSEVITFNTLRLLIVVSKAT